ncbi:peptidoglycan-binding domain-containing protein [Mesorhizobium sp. BAC0120]|uniref:peptidoglycan-binding domain-containing protein n=1 Tax=Mesorhizobium sp. BAC0120 TaxID=3090670 RepID=UPI00399BE010
MSCLRGSVGEGGLNHSRDVKYVQFLLCDWRYCAGGVGIVVDGTAGPKTKAAIREFQTRHTGIVDGRVDPAGRSIKELENIHINSFVSQIGISASKYSYLPPKPAAPGPLSWSGIVDRYFSALYSSFS